MKKMLVIISVSACYLHMVTGCRPPKYTRVKSPIFCKYERLKKVDAGKFDEETELKLRKVYKLRRL